MLRVHSEISNSFSREQVSIEVFGPVGINWSKYICSVCYWPPGICLTDGFTINQVRVHLIIEQGLRAGEVLNHNIVWNLFQWSAFDPMRLTGFVMELRMTILRWHHDNWKGLAAWSIDHWLTHTFCQLRRPSINQSINQSLTISIQSRIHRPWWGISVTAHIMSHVVRRTRYWSDSWPVTTDQAGLCWLGQV